MTTLKPGDFNVDVALLQIRLGIVPIFYYDNRTREAVMAFQKRNNISTDGVVGPQTYQVMNLKPAPKHVAVNPMKPWLPIAQSQIGIRANTLPLIGSWTMP